MSSSLRPKLQNFRKRNWGEIRGSLLEHIPDFVSVGSRPSPGLDGLAPLQALDPPENYGRYEDVPGLRKNTLWEAVFLFHKCTHANLAAQRLGNEGMHSWCLFNAYHSAYLGARGIMSLLGIALPNLKGGVQCAIDLFPEPEKSRTRRMGASTFHDFLIVKFGFNLDQKQLWEIFQRVLNVTAAECWNVQLQRDLAELATNKITPPRNHFLYKATFWPFEDLVVDGVPEDFGTLFGNELDVDSPGFLLRLSFSIAILFENLMTDLGTKSAVISEQVQGCRFLSSFEKADVAGYRTFLGQL